MIEPGLYAHIGATRTGKTTVALTDFFQLCLRERKTGLVVDSAHAKTPPAMARLPHARSLRDALEQVYGPKKVVVAWCPDQSEDFDRAAHALLVGGNKVVLVDEIGFWKKALRSDDSFFLKLLRTWYHARCSILVTTQHVSGDLGQVFLGCGPTLRVFRTDSPASLDWLEANHGLDRARVEALATGAYFEKRPGDPNGWRYVEPRRISS